MSFLKIYQTTYLQKEPSNTNIELVLQSILPNKPIYGINSKDAMELAKYVIKEILNPCTMLSMLKKMGQ